MMKSVVHHKTIKRTSDAMTCSPAQRVVALLLPLGPRTPPQPQPPPPYPPPQTPRSTIHDNRKHSSHCGILVKSPNEPPMPWRVRPRSVSSICPCHLDLDPPPRHTPRPPRSTTTANNRRTAETPSNLQMNLRCHGVFARAACRRSVPVA